jgi:hypothetical protein
MGQAKKASKSRPASKSRTGAASIRGSCLCGAVEIETGVPVFWAWHDHTVASRKAHGAVYATYVGTYRSKVRVMKGEELVARFEEPTTGNVRSFCSRCGSPVSYERKRSPKWVNLPRALFAGRTGRETKYHIGYEQMQDWVYLGAPVGPLKGYPGVRVERTRKKKRTTADDSLFDAEMFGPPPSEA